MSKIYNDTLVFCPRHDKDNRLECINLNSVLPLSDIYFCPSCQFHRSPQNCYHNTEAKFCSNCLTNYTNAPNEQTTCTKNCFSCPKCTSLLQITVLDGTAEGKPGKKFAFSCVYCDYNHTTQVITTPRSIHSILRSERRELEKTNADDALFNRLSKELEMGTSESSAPNAHTASVQTDTLLQNLSLSGLVAEKRDKQMNPFDEIPIHIPQLPNPIKLTFKKSSRCPKCNNYLILPQQEEGQPPTVNKFIVRFNAAEYMPTIKLSLPLARSTLDNPPPQPPKVFVVGEQYNFLVNFLSPLGQDAHVQVSTLPVLPRYFIQTKGAFEISLTVPVSSFTIKSDPTQTNLIKSIPTSFLTANTAVSRSELVLRLGNSLKSESYDHNNVENLESLVQSGNNWFAIPLNLLVEGEGVGSERAHVRVPLYVTVRSRLPESIRKLDLKKKEMSFGFWSVLDLGEYEFVHPECA